MIDWNKRKCEICGHRLSVHNKRDVCFHHPEHEDYYDIDYKESPKTSYWNMGRYHAIVDYYGEYKDS